MRNDTTGMTRIDAQLTYPRSGFERAFLHDRCQDGHELARFVEQRARQAEPESGGTAIERSQ